MALFWRASPGSFSRALKDTALWCADRDSDGYAGVEDCSTACQPGSGQLAGGKDCDDHNASVNPAAAETCDHQDNNCDGRMDEPEAQDAVSWCADRDGDGFAGSEGCSKACEPEPGQLLGGEDCDDTDSGVNPRSKEICDGHDNNCDGRVDEAEAQDAEHWCIDRDSDGFGDQSQCANACAAPESYVRFNLGADCADEDPKIHPGAAEVCGDGIDNNCNNTIDGVDEGCPRAVSGFFGCSSAPWHRGDIASLFLLLALQAARRRSMTHRGD